MTFWKSLGLTALFAGTAIATAPHARAETSSPLKITVRPLVRSIHFQVDPTGTTVDMAKASLEWRMPGEPATPLRKAYLVSEWTETVWMLSAGRLKTWS